MGETEGGKREGKGKGETVKEGRNERGKVGTREGRMIEKGEKEKVSERGKK